MKNIKQTIKNTVMGISVAIFGAIAVASFMPTTTYAADDKGNNGCGTNTAIISCNNVNGKSGAEGTGLWSLLLTVVNILVAGVGVLALVGIVYGSVLYTSAGGSPEQVKKARGIFVNVVIGVVAFGGMYTILNFLVPGGVFN